MLLTCQKQETLSTCRANGDVEGAHKIEKDKQKQSFFCTIISRDLMGYLCTGRLLCRGCPGIFCDLLSKQCVHGSSITADK